MVVVLSFVWFMDWTDRFIHKGGIGIFDIFFKIGSCAKEFWFFGLGVHYGLRIFRSLACGFRFSVFVINNCLIVFGFGFQCGFRIFLHLDSGFSLIQAAIMCLHWFGIATKPLYAPLVDTVSDLLGFWELECEHLSVLTVLHAVSVLVEYLLLQFCGCGWFFDGFEVSNRPSHPSIQW